MEGDDDYAEDRRADGAGAAGAEDAFAGGSLDGRSGVLPAHLNPDVVLLRRAYVQEKCVPELLPFQKDAVETLTTGLAQQQAALDAMNLEAAQEAESRPKDLGPAFASSSSDAQQASGPLSATSKSLYSADIERQRYLLAVYLRTRLRKIEKQHFFLSRQLAEEPQLFEDRVEEVPVEDEEGGEYGAEPTVKKVRRLPLLSDAEKAYLIQFSNLRASHLTTSVLDALPVESELWSGGEESTKDLHAMVTSSRPQTSAHVFAQFLHSVTGLVADSGDGSAPGAGDEEPLDLQQGRDGILPYFYIKKLLLDGKVRVH